jgi:hypothetical protein
LFFTNAKNSSREIFTVFPSNAPTATLLILVLKRDGQFDQETTHDIALVV